MASTLKLHGARFVVTLDPERRIIADGSVLIEGRRIAQVGKAADMESLAADRVIDARGMIVTPGFVNGHMHISYAHAVRGLLPDDLGADYLPTVFRLQAAMTEDEEYYTSLLAVTELLKYGTTCFMDPGSTKYLDACMRAYDESGCRIITGAHVTDQPNPIGVPVYPTSEAVEITERTVGEYDGRLDGRVRAWAMPFSADFASRDLLVAARRIADENSTGMSLHQSNSPASVAAHQANHGMRPVSYLESIGVLGPNVTLAHVLDLDDAEVECMVRTGTRAVMCPTAALKSAGGMTSTAMLPEMLARGITVGLGTDSGNNSNLVETMRSVYLAAVVYKDARGDTGVIPAETALELGTIESARALGLDADIGSVEAGKKADLVLFDTRRPEWGSLHNPVNTLVYGADGRSIHTVIVDGRVVIEDHAPAFVDEATLIERVQKVGEGLLARTGISFPWRWPLV